MPKKLHWTQTPEGKKKLALSSRRGVRTRRQRAAEKLAATQMRSHNEPTTLDTTTTYALGRVESVLEAIAAWAGVPSAAFTERVGNLLVAKAHRKVLGG